MLDTITKRRIDTARDILVGKLPDPKSQVEQITIALIYKFMDDMDKQSEELGGKSKFFTGEYEKYSWSKIFDPRVSGFELVNLYGEALQRMNQNPNIPQLFRNIFKNAYLPYRDPETLKMFLKIIGEFEYDYSEKLGDAFEYLLSIMGSQGDAGQFRTPRHIIDFMVKVVDPSKNETILDPACGTAGFLISSFNHIQNKNKKDGRVNLTPDERTRLIENLSGYDISPDMQRLSLVNMYLHGFQSPKIYEYDTLTSEEKWNEFYDIILANPPFMSPKGGIKPHKRFSVQVNRSEVLFVDYIAEHLNPNGRGGVIVPEGIIFQSGIAYKKLRKMLIENSLYAVVSLPAGVFNPYSGVKTSILFLSKYLSKKTDKILFVKVDNDGFGLGAQRREVKENDLPLALEIINKYKQRIIENKEMEFNLNEAKYAHVVKKEKITESGDYNLSGDRYKKSVAYNGKWHLVELGEVVNFLPKSKRKAGDGQEKGSYPFFTSSENQYKFLNEVDYIEEALILGTGGSASVNISKGFSTSADVFVISSKILKSLNNRFLYYLLSKNKKVIDNGFRGVGLKHLSKIYVRQIKIPLPPLEIQEQIVAELDSYQKIVDGAKQVVENYKPIFKIDPEWEMIKLFKICENLDGKRIPITKSDRKTGPYPYYGASGIVDYTENYIFDEDLLLISEDGANLLTRVTPIAFSVSGKVWVNNHAHVLRFENIATQIFVELYINSINIKNYVTGSAQPKLNQKNLNSIMIPCPHIEIRKNIIKKIESEQKIINANKELITIFENKIRDKIADVWGE